MIVCDPPMVIFPNLNNKLITKHSFVKSGCREVSVLFREWIVYRHACPVATVGCRWVVSGVYIVPMGLG